MLSPITKASLCFLSACPAGALYKQVHENAPSWQEETWEAAGGWPGSLEAVSEGRPTVSFFTEDSRGRAQTTRWGAGLPGCGQQLDLWGLGSHLESAGGGRVDCEGRERPFTLEPRN